VPNPVTEDEDAGEGRDELALDTGWRAFFVGGCLQVRRVAGP